MAAFLANVGANAAHRVRSPLYGDGTFTIYPIPENLPWAPPMLQLASVWQDRPVHLDPDLDGDPPTYGDNCRTAGRAYSLRRARAGDVIVFLARLHPVCGGQPGFFLVGALTIEDVMRDVCQDPGFGWWDGNAHVRRARSGQPWDSFWVFRGDPRLSSYFTHAVPFGRGEATALFGESWTWRENRTDLQTIGSNTRAVRRLTGISEQRLREFCA